MAGSDVEALRVLKQLTENAINENRFLDAGYYYWMQSTQHLEKSCTDVQYIEKFKDCSMKADCYYAYDSIYKFMASYEANSYLARIGLLELTG